MSKLLGISVILAMLGSSSALGGIIQGQNFAIGTANDIHLSLGQQGANSAQDLLIDISQDSSGGGLAVVSAHVVGITGEIGSAWGAAALLGVSRLGVRPVLAVDNLLVPRATEVNTALARARLNSLLLRAQ